MLMPLQRAANHPRISREKNTFEKETFMFGQLQCCDLYTIYRP